MKKPLFGGKAAQIRGIRKALKNRRTPRQLIPSLKKRLAKLTACILFALIAPIIRAQAPVSIIPTQQTLAPAGTACTGTGQTFTVQNRNQTQHYAYVAPTLVTNLTMVIQGINPPNAGVFTISDLSTNPTSAIGNSAALTGSGYFPIIQVVVTCSPAVTGTFALSYSGAQATPNVNVGSYLISQVDKAISLGAAANTSYSATGFTSPFGNSYGMLTFEYVGAGPAGSTISVQCQNQTGLGPPSGATGAFTFTPATTTLVNQSFVVPPGICPTVSVSYTSGGASSSTYNFDYVFLQPGTSETNSYTHIAGTTATVVKAGPGTVHSVVVGTSAAGTISLFDLASGSCTGTPSTNTVSVITEFASAAPPPPFYLYDVLFQNGICVKASAAMDLTVSYQ